MKIEQCIIVITSEKEFSNVSKICLDSGLKWGDDDNTYDSITTRNKVIAICNDETTFMYDSNLGYSYKKELSYENFMSKYGKEYNKKEVKQMKIEPCSVKVTSREEFDKVSKIFLDNGVEWYFPETNKYDSVIGDIRILKLDADNDLLFIRYNSDKDCDGEYISFRTFMNKYDNNMTYNQTTGIEDCKIRTVTREEFKEVEDICFSKDVDWHVSGKTHKDFATDSTRYIKIHNKQITDWEYSVPDDFISFNEFKRKYAGIMSSVLTTLKESLFKKKKPNLNQRI